MASLPPSPWAAVGGGARSPAAANGGPERGGEDGLDDSRLFAAGAGAEEEEEDEDYSEAEEGLGFQSATVFVGNLDPRVNARLLYELMIQAGPVAQIRIPGAAAEPADPAASPADPTAPPPQQQHRGYAFCEFASAAGAAYACKLFEQPGACLRCVMFACVLACARAFISFPDVRCFLVYQLPFFPSPPKQGGLRLYGRPVTVRLANPS